MSPLKRDIKAAITRKPQAIRVGNFSTIPVFKYGIKQNGKKKMLAIIIKKTHK